MEGVIQRCGARTTHQSELASRGGEHRIEREPRLVWPRLCCDRARAASAEPRGHNLGDHRDRRLHCSCAHGSHRRAVVKYLLARSFRLLQGHLGRGEGRIRDAEFQAVVITNVRLEGPGGSEGCLEKRLDGA